MNKLRLYDGGVRFAIFLNVWLTESQEDDLLAYDCVEETGSTHFQQDKVVFHFDTRRDFEKNYQKAKRIIRNVLKGGCKCE